MRAVWVAAGVGLATVAALALQTGVVARTGFFMGDFRAFYCAAQTASQGGDPYRTEPLRSCEVGLGRTRFFAVNPGVTIPAPLPGYAIAALVPLARLPFWGAVVCWCALLLAAWYACIATLSRFAAVPRPVALAAMGLGLGVISLPLGEVVPIAVACICAAAYAAWRGRAVPAALCAAGSMIEPHLGLPVCLALAIWVPATRLPLALSAAGLGALSLAVLGPAVNLEYFTAVLPAHALSEATRDTQFSLTAVLCALGAGAQSAAKAGALWYAAMLVAGTYLAGRLAKRTGNDAYLVCVPPAFAVLGGTFIHITQIAAAVPAAVLLASMPGARYRRAGLIALLALAVPWVWAVSPAIVVAPLVPVAYLAWRYTNENLAATLVAGLAAAALTFGLSELAAAAPHAAALTHAAAPAMDPRFAEASWSAFTSKSSSGALASWMLRLPTWIALALLLGLLAGEARVPRPKDVPALALAALCTILPFAGAFYGERTSGWLAVDFRAYYCAALAQREGLDPYQARSLHACESAPAGAYYRAPANVTVPAPYPPYALAIFSPMTLLPFGAAAFAWWLVLSASLLGAAYTLARIAGSSFSIAWAALALSLGLTSFSAGNALPLAMGALLCAVLLARRGRFALAACATAIAAIEPQVALPAAIGLFAAYPRMRGGLTLAAAVLAGLSLAAGGFARSIAYVTAVLPAHALSEVSRDNQYSLSTVAAALGLPDASAVLLGSISYAIAVAAGVAAGVRLAARYGDPALAPLVAAAFSLLGGSFVHTGEIAAAVPAALLLFVREGGRRAWLFSALALLAVPWMLATSVTMFLAPVFPVAYLTYELYKRDRTAPMLAAFVSFALIAALFRFSGEGAQHAIAAVRTHPPIDPNLAEAGWRDFVLANSTNRPAMWLLRLPTWAGLIAFAAGAVALARNRVAPPAAAHLVESRA